MPWSSLANNQTISRANLQDAINQGYFTLKAAFPSDAKQVTKANVDTYINVPDSTWYGYASKESTQLLVKTDLPTTVQNNGSFILDAQYGMYFTSMSGSVGSLPSFSFPVTGGNTTVSFNYTIPAQNITLGIDGSPTYTPINIGLYIDSSLITSQQITSWPGSYTITLPVNVSAGQTIRFAINTGTTPPPPSFTFQNQQISNVLVSKTNGTYMLATTGERVMDNTYFDYVKTAGYLWRSANGGTSWTKTSLYGKWTNLSASDSGQYMLATTTGGYCYRSSDYGANWTAITVFGNQAFSSGCVFNNGYMILCTESLKPNVYRSTNAGVSWSNASPVISGTTIQNPFVSIACGASSGYVILADSYGNLYMSNDYGATYSQAGLNPKVISYNYMLRSSSDGVYMTMSQIQQGASTTNSILYSTNQGASWSILSGSTITTPATNGYWIGYGLSTSSSSYAQSTSNVYTQKVTNFSGLSSVTSVSGTWKCADLTNGGSTILFGSLSGLYRSTNGGTTFQPL